MGTINKPLLILNKKCKQTDVFCQIHHIPPIEPIYPLAGKKLTVSDEQPIVSERIKLKPRPIKIHETK